MQTLQRSFGNALATSADHSKPDQFRSRVTCWRPGPSRLAATYAAELYVQPPSYRRLSLKRLSKPSALPVCMASSGTKTVLVPVANGSEEIEAVTVIDVLRRAGAEVTVASVEDSLQVEMSRQVRVTADKLISECDTTTFDAIALPGGMPGAESLSASKPLDKLIRDQKQSGRLLSAICAAPAVVLESKGLLDGLKATSHPGFQSKLSNQSAIKERVVEIENIITSQAPGTAMEFSLAIVKQLFGQEKADEVAGPMVVKG